MVKDASTIPKYSRVGYINLDRPVDHLVATFMASLAAEVGYLPTRWTYLSREKFLEDHGHLGNVLVARAASSHTLVCGGTKVARFWTDVENHAKVQVATPLVLELQKLKIPIKSELIPASNKRKAKDFLYQVLITKEAEAKVLALLIKKVYDV